MKLFEIYVFIGFLITCASASASAEANQNDDSGLQTSISSMKPTDWLSLTELQSLPEITENITLQQFENMSVEEGQKLIQKIFRLAKTNRALLPTFVPSASNVAVIFMKPNGQHEETNLSEMVDKAKNEAKFITDEVTIFITGLPETSPAVAKANKKLVQAYMARYMSQQQPMANNSEAGKKQAATSSEEDSKSGNEGRQISGDFVIIKLGTTLSNMKRYIQLDVEETGKMLAKVLVDLHNEADLPETVHLIAQGISAQIAGSAARYFKHSVGHRLRRITALDPANKFSSDKSILTGLARGDADFVDAIHTNTKGLGTRWQAGDADFYVMGPSAIAPGADNVVEASMRATRYFAESLRSGMEHNFPAVPANSMRQYEKSEGHGKRAYMGIATAYDSKGDYMLEVNAKSPFGKSSPAKRQGTYHD